MTRRMSTATVSTITTVETAAVQAQIAAGMFNPGTQIRITVWGQYTQTSTTAATGAIYVRYGPNGTSSDTLIQTLAPKSNAAASTAIPFKIEAVVTCRVNGTSGKLMSMLDLHGNGTTGYTAITQVLAPSGAAPAAVTVNTTVANYLTLSLKSGVSTGTLNIFHASMEVVNW